MKIFWLIIFFPFICLGQTVHSDEGSVKYKGKTTATPEDISAKVAALKIKNLQLDSDNTASSTWQGKIRLTTPYQLIRQMYFEMKIQPSADGYEYVLNNFYLHEEPRKGKKRIVPSRDLLDAMEEGGQKAIDIERLLNETDMRVQELIARLKKN